jgi:hypothetical protein
MTAPMWTREGRGKLAGTCSPPTSEWTSGGGRNVPGHVVGTNNLTAIVPNMARHMTVNRRVEGLGSGRTLFIAVVGYVNTWGGLLKKSLIRGEDSQDYTNEFSSSALHSPTCVVQ